MATVTKELSGKIYKGKTGWIYLSYEYGATFCHDFTDRVSEYKPLMYATPSWGGGVVDYGAKRMAIALLFMAHRDWFGRVDIATEHYKQFAKEVVANLPDEWSMSKAEIRKWVKEKERKKK